MISVFLLSILAQRKHKSNEVKIRCCLPQAIPYSSSSVSRSLRTGKRNAVEDLFSLTFVLNQKFQGDVVTITNTQLS
jgi:hypothetical protein